MRQVLRRMGWLAATLVLAAQPLAAEPAKYGYERDIRPYNLAHGRVVFVNNCMKCHEAGRKGAPLFDDSADWLPRIRQPLSTLIEHATEGHGRMPAKGDQELSDQDVAAAVAYVVHHSRQVIDHLNALPPTGAGALDAEAYCGPGEHERACADRLAADAAILNMFMILVGQDRGR